MPINLNEDQVTAILTEGLNRGMYECLNNTLPADPKIRMADATELVSMVQAAANSGNKSDNIQTILFLAQVDQKPDIAPVSAQVQLAQVNQALPIKEVAEPVAQGFDISQVSDGVLEGLIIGLDKFPNNDKVENERKSYLAEKERRSNAQASKSQDVSQGTTPQATPNKAGEIAAEGAQAADASAGQPVTQAEGPNAGGVAADGGAGGSVGISDEDAGAFARAQTPETSPEGKVPKAKKVEEDAERAAIIEKLTLPMIKNHGIDLTKLEYISTYELKTIIENPDGKTEDKMTIHDSEVKGVAKDNNSVGGIVPEVAAPVRTVSKADLGIDDASVNESENQDRENLEALVTGPMLKAYGRGRKEIPSIGSNELRFMVLNPDGKISPDDLVKAKIMDNPESVKAVADSSPMVVTKEIVGPPVEDSFLSKDDGLEEVTLPSGKVIKVAASKVAQDDETQDRQTDAEQIVEHQPVQVEEAPDRTIVQAAQESVAKAAPESSAKDASTGQQQVMEIIQKENFPLPPEIDGKPPFLPNDVSSCSRDQLFSLHAQFHACESRINWILSQHEDKLGDAVKLRTNREAIVAASVPFMGEDGKRNTNEFRDSQVNADKEVLDFGMEEHELKKTVSKLKVLQRNYHADCERLSRQMSKYEQERSDAPR